MRIRLGAGDLGASSADVAVCFAFEGDGAPRGVAGAALRAELAARMKADRFRGRRGETVIDARAGTRGPARFVVVGLGPADSATPEAVRQGCARAARLAGGTNAQSLVVGLPAELPSGPAANARAAVEGIFQGAYRFDRYVTDPARKRAGIRTVDVFVKGPKKELDAAVERGAIAGEAVAFARDLVNEAPSTLNPAEFARLAALESKRSGLTARALSAAELQKLGMGALLAVGRGSVHPPRVVHLRYVPRRGAASARVALVGKGVTFDSGGLDVKTSAGMLNMKGDMAGAAAVLSAMRALGRLNCRAEVHGFLGLVENMIGQSSYKPGDILPTHSGKTVEVTNTDAEGRLVLCDLLSYAAASLKPDALVDLATLTGACAVALGRHATGVFSRHDALQSALLAAGRDAGERLWPLPMFEDYLESLQDGPADLRNSGERYGGASIAAMFLGEFVPKNVPWVHLDICGPAFFEKPTPESVAGGTGAGVATLLRWLEGV